MGTLSRLFLALSLRRVGRELCASADRIRVAGIDNYFVCRLSSLVVVPKAILRACTGFCAWAVLDSCIRAGPGTTSETKIKTWQSLGFPEKNGQKCRFRPICQSPARRSDGAGAKGASGMHMHSRLNLIICLVSCASCCASSKSPAFGDQLLR